MFSAKLLHLLLITFPLNCSTLAVTECQYVADICSLEHRSGHKGTDGQPSAGDNTVFLRLRRGRFGSVMSSCVTYVNLLSRDEPEKNSCTSEPPDLTSPGSIQANIFVVNKPCGIEFNCDEVPSIRWWCPRRRGDDQN